MNHKEQTILILSILSKYHNDITTDKLEELCKAKIPNTATVGAILQQLHDEKHITLVGNLVRITEKGKQYYESLSLSLSLSIFQAVYKVKAVNVIEYMMKNIVIAIIVTVIATIIAAYLIKYYRLN